MSVDNTKVVRAYIKLRDARDVARRAWEEADAKLKLKQEVIESAMLKFLIDNKMDSVKTPVGTFYRQEEIMPAGADWDLIYKFITDNDAFEMLERRIKKGFVKEYMETNGGSIPPGVTVHREYVVRVRRGGDK